MATALSPTPLDLESFFEVSAERPNRKVLVQQPGLKVLHLTLAPGQELPSHRHPSSYVLVQGLKGITSVQVEQQETTLSPQQLLSFSGESLVSLRNNSGAPSALLIILVNQVNERKADEDPAHT